MLLYFGVFSSPFSFILKTKKEEANMDSPPAACAAVRRGVGCKRRGEKTKTHFWGFLGACYQNFDFFFLFRLHLRSGSYFDSWVQSPFSWDECSCAPRNRFWCWWKRVLQVTSTNSGVFLDLVIKKK